MVLSIGFLVMGVAIALNSSSHKDDLFLIPSIVGLLWSLTTYALLSSFHHISRAPNKNDRFFLRIKLRLKRIWYWALGVLFLGATATAMVVSVRLINIWYKDFIG
jgi:hypothetical protein